MRRHSKQKMNRRIRVNVEALESRRLLSIYADFNGDGFDDMAVGIPLEDLGAVVDAGAVLVVYGTASGLNSAGSQVWTQDSSGITDAGETGDEFGAALAGGDFNNDGFADLAIGAPGESINGAFGAGAIHVLLGSASGLTFTKSQFFHQDSNRIREIGESGDHFGSVLAAGDFNNDGATDLAVGVPGEDVGSIVDAGGIQVFYGAHAGLVPTSGARPLNLESAGVPGVATADDEFGHALSAGDFNGDGRDDLAIGIPGFDPSGVQFGGAVCVMYGATGEITTTGSQLWSQDSSDITGGAEEFDEFGFSVAAGDFNGDGRDDLAIGVPFETLGTLGISEGFVHVLYGSASGITATGSDAFDQGDVGGLVEPVDVFGWALVAADFNGDGRDDLAVGSPGENVGLLDISAGVVHVIFGSSSGINTSTGVEIAQEDVGTGEQSEDFDDFGETLAAGDFNGNGKADLVIGAPWEDIGTEEDCGRVFVLYGTQPPGFAGGQAWDEGSPGIDGGIEPGDEFGGGLDAGGGRSNSDAPGRPDLSKLITADIELDSLITKPNKRRLLSGRR